MYFYVQNFIIQMQMTFIFIDKKSVDFDLLY